MCAACVTCVTLQEQENGRSCEFDTPALGSRGPGSSQKTIKGTYKKNEETGSRLSTRESIASRQDVKAEWKLHMKQRKNLIHAKSKYKFASANKLTSDEEEQQASLKNPLESTSFADYNQLGFHLRSNIFQGGPMQSRSVVKDSYTSDVFQKAVRDPKNWHGRRTDELGKWHKKNVLYLNVLKALEDKHRNRKGKT